MSPPPFTLNDAFRIAEARVTTDLGLPRSVLWSKAGWSRQQYEAAMTSTNPTVNTVKRIALLLGTDWKALAFTTNPDDVRALPLPTFDWLTAIEENPEAIKQPWTLTDLARAAGVTP